MQIPKEKKNKTEYKILSFMTHLKEPCILPSPFFQGGWFLNSAFQREVELGLGVGGFYNGGLQSFLNYIHHGRPPAELTNPSMTTILEYSEAQSMESKPKPFKILL